MPLRVCLEIVTFRDETPCAQKENPLDKYGFDYEEDWAMFIQRRDYLSDLETLWRKRMPSSVSVAAKHFVGCTMIAAVNAAHARA